VSPIYTSMGPWPELDWAWPDDLMIAGLLATEIVGYFDPTPASDVLNATLNVVDGNYVDGAISLAGALTPGGADKGLKAAGNAGGNLVRGMGDMASKANKSIHCGADNVILRKAGELLGRCFVGETFVVIDCLAGVRRKKPLDAESTSRELDRLFAYWEAESDDSDDSPERDHSESPPDRTSRTALLPARHGSYPEAPLTVPNAVAASPMTNAADSFLPVAADDDVTEQWSQSVDRSLDQVLDNEPEERRPECGGCRPRLASSDGGARRAPNSGVEPNRTIRAS
jgi:hypothetical protein